MMLEYYMISERISNLSQTSLLCTPAHLSDFQSPAQRCEKIDLTRKRASEKENQENHHYNASSTVAHTQENNKKTSPRVRRSVE